MTIFSPAAIHFLVQASWLALAPFAPHLLSLTHPLTVAVLPISSNANAVRANTKQSARQSTRTFFMADFSPFVFAAAQGRGYGRNSIGRPEAIQPDRTSIGRTIPQPTSCH